MDCLHDWHFFCSNLGIHNSLPYSKNNMTPFFLLKDELISYVKHNNGYLKKRNQACLPTVVSRVTLDVEYGYFKKNFVYL